MNSRKNVIGSNKKIYILETIGVIKKIRDHANKCQKRITNGKVNQITPFKYNIDIDLLNFLV